MGGISSILDNKRHPVLFAAAYIFGIILYYRRGNNWPVMLFLIGGGILFILILQKRRVMAVACLVTVIAITSFFVCRYQDIAYEKRQNYAAAGADAEISGLVYKKQIKSNCYLYYLKNSQLISSSKTQIESENIQLQFNNQESTLYPEWLNQKRIWEKGYFSFLNEKTYPSNKKCGKILVYTDEDDVPIGSEVVVKGQMELFSEARNEGNFDMADYYKSQNISFCFFAESMRPVEEKGNITVFAGKNSVLRWVKDWNFREELYQFQKKISNVFKRELNQRDAGILCTLVLGNNAFLDDEIKELYQGAGISHILAISGLHISILGVGFFRFLRKFRCSYHTCAIAGSLLVFSFAFMSGMGVSARRAVIMFLLMMGAQVVGRSYDSVNALAFAALILLISQPLNLYQSGFLFSFVSLTGITTSVFLISEADSKNETGKKGKTGSRQKAKHMLEDFRNRLISGVILQLFLLPVTAWFYYEVPLYAFFLNFLILPFCSWLLGFGLLGGIVGLQFFQISKWLLVVCHMILNLYEKAIGVTDFLPFAHVITGKPSVWMMMGYYVVLIWGCFLVQNKSLKNGKKFLWTGIPVVLLCFMLFLPKQELCRIDFLDVSQGDGIHLADGEGKHIMIDGGSTDEKEIGKYRIEPFLKYHGIRRIHAWIVTHGDEDHCCGVLELMERGYPIDYLLLAEAMPRNEAWENLVETAEKNNTTVLYTKATDVLNLAECEMKCLYPSATDTDEDVNALSQVWSFQKNDMSVLFTGDIGERQEKEIQSRGLLQDYVVLKAAHHGSKNSSCEDFLAVVLPEYTIISSGENNRYGHPHQETLTRLEKTESEIWQTQTRGQISIIERRKKWEVWFYCLKE